MALVTDIVPPGELTGFIRQLDPATYGFTLNEFLPDTAREDIEYAFTRSDRTRQMIGAYRAFDVESPISSRPGFSRVRGEIPPASIKIPLGEEARLRLESLRGFDRGLADQIFDDAALITEALLGRFEMARGEALFSAKVTFSVDAGYLATLNVNYGTKTTITAPGVLWSTVATATPIKDLGVMVTDYMAGNGGLRPAVVLTSTKVRNLMLSSTEVKNFAAFQGIVPSIVGVDQLAAILAAQGLPPVVTYYTSVNVAGATTRVTPLNDVALLPAPNTGRFGETTMGITAESLELVSSQFLTLQTAPGLTGVVMKTFDPVSVWTKVAGLVLPVIKDPKLIGSVTVSA
jgi:hypothetical protein